MAHLNIACGSEVEDCPAFPTGIVGLPASVTSGSFVVVLVLGESRCRVSSPELAGSTAVYVPIPLRDGRGRLSPVETKAAGPALGDSCRPNFLPRFEPRGRIGSDERAIRSNI